MRGAWVVLSRRKRQAIPKLCGQCRDVRGRRAVCRGRPSAAPATGGAAERGPGFGRRRRRPKTSFSASVRLLRKWMLSVDERRMAARQRFVHSKKGRQSPEQRHDTLAARAQGRPLTDSGAACQNRSSSSSPAARRRRRSVSRPASCRWRQPLRGGRGDRWIFKARIAVGDRLPGGRDATPYSRSTASGRRRRSVGKAPGPAGGV